MWVLADTITRLSVNNSSHQAISTSRLQKVNFPKVVVDPYHNGFEHVGNTLQVQKAFEYEKINTK